MTLATFNLRLDSALRARIDRVMKEQPFLRSRTATVLYLLDLGLRALEREPETKPQ